MAWVSGTLMAFESVQHGKGCDETVGSGSPFIYNDLFFLPEHSSKVRRSRSAFQNAAPIPVGAARIWNAAVLSGLVAVHVFATGNSSESGTQSWQPTSGRRNYSPATPGELRGSRAAHSDCQQYLSRSEVAPGRNGAA